MLKKRKRWFAAFVVTFGLVNSHADAAPQSPEDVEAGEKAMESFGQCVVKVSHRQLIDKFLAADPFSKKAGYIGSNIATPDCASFGSIRFHPVLFRASLYDALYRRDFGNSAVLPTKDQPDLDFATEVTEDVQSDVKSFVALRAFGDCVSRVDPAGTRKVLLTDRGSPAEDAAIGGLQDAMGACLNPGMELRFSHMMLRGILAEALYKLSAASTAGSPPK